MKTVIIFTAGVGRKEGNSLNTLLQPWIDIKYFHGSRVLTMHIFVYNCSFWFGLNVTSLLNKLMYFLTLCCWRSMKIIQIEHHAQYDKEGEKVLVNIAHIHYRKEIIRTVILLPKCVSVSCRLITCSILTFI